MNRKSVAAIATAVLGVSIFVTGCGKADKADQSANDGAAITPSATANDRSTTKDDVAIQPAAPVIHPNVMLTLKCMDDGKIVNVSEDVNGTSGKQSLPLTVRYAKPLASIGADCGFRLTSNASTASFVMARPRLRDGAQKHGIQWAFSEAMTAQGLNFDSGQRVPLLLSKGQCVYVYAEVNGLPKPDSFNSTLVDASNPKWATTYNRQVREMNELTLTKLAGVKFPLYTD